MAEEYTPTTEHVRQGYAYSESRAWASIRTLEFDRWLASVRAEREPILPEERALDVSAVRRVYVVAASQHRDTSDQTVQARRRAGAEFDRWLAVRDAETRRHALKEAALVAENAPGSEATGYYSSSHDAGYREAQWHIARDIRTLAEGADRG